MSGDRLVVGRSVRKVDGVKLVTGGAAFTDDVNIPGLLCGKILPSPHAHARIRRIDTSKAKALPGVHAVLTYKDVPRVPHTTAGQALPEPSPYDTYLLDSKVRFVGDRVAAVAANWPSVARISSSTSGDGASRSWRIASRSCQKRAASASMRWAST